MSDLFLNRNILTRYGNTVYDASNPNNDSSIIPANDAQISAFTDTGRAQNNTTQATGGNQPVYKTGIINGLNVVRFAGAQYLSCANSAANNSAGALSIFALVTASTLAGSARIIGNASATNGCGFGRNAAKLMFTGRAVFDATTTSDYLVADVPAVIGMVYNGTNSTAFYFNSPTAVETKSSGVMLASTAPFRIGSFDGSQQFWAGDYAKSVVGKRAFSAGEITLIINYLKSIGGL